MNEVFIETERLIIREFMLQDSEELHKICNQEHILKWMPDWRGTLNELREWIIWAKSQCENSNKEKARVMLAIFLKNENKLVGMVGIGNKKEVDDEIEIAYFISEDYCSNGYITEAVKAMIQWSFFKLGVNYLIAIVEIENFPSKRIIEKCGFVNNGTKMILNSGEQKEKMFYYYRVENNFVE